jgi:hypothetical protein
LIVAVVPFAVLPLAHAVERFGGSRVFRVVAAFLLLISIHNALVYNTNIAARVIRLSDDSFSGWKTMLVFPRMWGDVPSGVWPTWLLVSFWLAVVAVLVAMSWRVERLPAPTGSFSPWRYSMLVGATVLGAGVLGGALTQAAKGFDDRLMMRPEAARARLAQLRR